MSAEHGVVIVGGGQAAAVATRTLRRRGYAAPITILGEEPHRPYQRPPLSKEFLVKGDDSALDLLAPAWTEAQGVTVRTGVRATRVDSASGAVDLADGTSVRADHVLLATGGRPRRFPGADGDRIRYLRTRADAETLRGDLAPGARLVVVGAGFIGAEVASSARALGAEVTVLEMAPAPLLGLLGPRLAETCVRRHTAAGVDLRCGVTVAGIQQAGEEVVVETSAGRFVADVVVIGIGIEPNDEIAAASGLVVGNGIHVDEHCRTSHPHVYAAGDVANQLHPLLEGRVRVEHFDNASKQAATAANNILGRTTVAADPHWFWSDQYDANLQYVGHASGSDDIVLRGSTEADSWTAFFLRDGVLRAAFAVDNPEDIMVARELVAGRRVVAPEVLADPDVDLFEMVEQA
ncbi:NAD(P)/FAD-dependent oxidoreductase [Nocardioides sp. zg-DK7169]|uniref:NAD(P)/FAD-dependent oxidoreductase n=1 Tax=Nocardioides sp. zg-DK7169 TaxID=2736600 RepID=UPI0015557AA5|nr:FAD-dependent oxidoreductase [Nocardioides sp. zg-DK7169]NPC96839.1 FAD-dependent oxidoreductase [Nocardioides sp. zg-DK7169]